MSWDILVFNSIKPVDFERNDWPHFRSREAVIAGIKKAFPESNWDDLSWGVLENDKAIIEFSVGEKEAIENTFMLHVRGGSNPTAEIASLCKLNDWIAFDISGNQYIDNDQPIEDSFKNWERYRDHVVSSTAGKKAWWKFW